MVLLTRGQRRSAVHDLHEKEGTYDRAPKSQHCSISRLRLTCNAEGYRHEKITGLSSPRGRNDGETEQPIAAQQLCNRTLILPMSERNKYYTVLGGFLGVPRKQHPSYHVGVPLSIPTFTPNYFCSTFLRRVKPCPVHTSDMASICMHLSTLQEQNSSIFNIVVKVRANYPESLCAFSPYPR